MHTYIARPNYNKLLEHLCIIHVAEMYSWPISYIQYSEYYNRPTTVVSLQNGASRDGAQDDLSSEDISNKVWNQLSLICSLCLKVAREKQKHADKRWRKV